MRRAALNAQTTQAPSAQAPQNPYTDPVACWDKRVKEHDVPVPEMSVDIDIGRRELFHALATPNLWAVCAPATVGVGGITKRPFKAGDLVLDKELGAGSAYNIVQYQIDDTHAPRNLTYTGKYISVADTAFNKQLPDHVHPGFGARYEYVLEKLSKHSTRWTRKLTFYFDEGVTLEERNAWGYNGMSVSHAPYDHTTLYFQCVKQFLETKDYGYELYGSFADSEGKLKKEFQLGNCDCKSNPKQAAKCHKGFAKAFERAHAKGSLCTTVAGTMTADGPQSWCYTSLECDDDDVEGLEVSSQGICKFRDAEGDDCKAHGAPQHAQDPAQQISPIE